VRRIRAGLLRSLFTLLPFNKRITIGERRYLERVRGYDLDEIALMFTTCNLTIAAAFGDFAGSHYERSSPRLIILGSKSR